MAEREDTASVPGQWKSARVLVAGLLAAMVATIGAGLGSRALGLFDEEPSPVSYSSIEQVHECGTGLFVSGARAASGKIPMTEDWAAFRRSNRAAVQSPNDVQVSIQGESARTITLTRIDFVVERRTRPVGAMYANPCGDSIRGRHIQVDLDKKPPAVIGSSEDPDAAVGEIDSAGRSPNKPLRFPWTVSITDPLLLDVVAETRRCYCVWRAKITWRSGAKSGTIDVDNNGDGYVAVGGDGAKTFLGGADTWSLLR